MICPWAEAELLVDAHLEEIGGSTDRTDDADRREERSSRWYADVAVFSERVVGDRVFDADPGSPPHAILWRLSAPPARAPHRARSPTRYLECGIKPCDILFFLNDG
jgi:hypothetical protein